MFYRLKLEEELVLLEAFYSCHVSLFYLSIVEPFLSMSNTWHSYFATG